MQLVKRLPTKRRPSFEPSSPTSPPQAFTTAHLRSPQPLLPTRLAILHALPLKAQVYSSAPDPSTPFSSLLSAPAAASPEPSPTDSGLCYTPSTVQPTSRGLSQCSRGLKSSRASHYQCRYLDRLDPFRSGQDPYPKTVPTY